MENAIVKPRNVAIDILRFIATLAIFNHMSGNLYVRYPFLATGGALGITLFFFISGFTLYGGRFDRFDNWYKRRLSRVWPTAFIVALACVSISGEGGSVRYAFTGGGWFIQSILIAYIVLYIVKVVLRIPALLAFILSVGVVCGWYFFGFDYCKGYTLFGDSIMRSLVLYPFLFLGAFVSQCQEKFRFNVWGAMVVSVLCFLLFNGVVAAFSKGVLSCCHQLVLMPIQLIFVVSVYFAVSKVRLSKIAYWVVRFVGGLCLEMYLSYVIVRNNAFNNLFPFSIFICLVIALTFAYFIRCLSRAFQQTFQKESYDWHKVFALI